MPKLTRHLAAAGLSAVVGATALPAAAQNFPCGPAGSPNALPAGLPGITLKAVTSVASASATVHTLTNLVPAPGNPTEKLGITLSISIAAGATVQSVTLMDQFANVLTMTQRTATTNGTSQNGVEVWAVTSGVVPGRTYTPTITLSTADAITVGAILASGVRQLANGGAVACVSGQNPIGTPTANPQNLQSLSSFTTSLFTDVASISGDIATVDPAIFPGSAPGTSAYPERWDCNTGSGACVASGSPARGVAADISGSGSTVCRHSLNTFLGAFATSYYQLSATDNWAEAFCEIIPTDVSTAADLDSVEVQMTPKGALVQWHASWEEDSLGYHVWKQVPGQAAVQLTQEPLLSASLVLGELGRAGHTYAWVDRQPSANANYWVEEVDLEGRTTRFDARLVSNGRSRFANTINSSAMTPRQAQLTQAEMANVKSLASDARLGQQRRIAGANAVKVGVREAGWYQVSGADLIAAGMAAGTAMDRIHGYVDGQEIALQVSNPKGVLSADETVEFYGVGADVASTDTRTYWFQAGAPNAKRIRSAGKVAKASVSRFKGEAAVQDRNSYMVALNNGVEDNFFAGGVANAPYARTLNLESVDARAQGRLEVSLQSVLTSGVQEIDVRLNNVLLGTVTMTGKMKQVASFAVPAGLAIDGANAIELAPRATGRVSLVKWIRLSQPRFARTSADELFFQANGAGAVDLGSAARVLDVTDATNPVELTTKDGTFQAAGSGVRAMYARSFDADAKAPVFVQRHQGTALHQLGEQDAVIIAHKDFMAAAQRLATQRRAEGFRVAVVDVDQVFAEFAYGNHSADAIRRFLSTVKPRYAVLVGDSSYDPRNHLQLGGTDFVPTALVDQESREYEMSSDSSLGDFNGDAMPEVIIGRLPVSTAAEANAVVSKILAGDVVIREALTVADRTEFFDFSQQAAETAGALGPTVAVEAVARTAQSNDAALKSQIDRALGKGVDLVAYYGHGGPDRWAGLLDSQDIAGSSSTGRQSLYVLNACLNGMFHDPALKGFGESALLANGKGATAVWGATSWVAPSDSYRVAQTLDQKLKVVGSNGTLLGDLARSSVAMGTADFQRSWVLLGDPMTRVRIQR